MRHLLGGGAYFNVDTQRCCVHLFEAWHLLQEVRYTASNSLQLIWRAFSYIFQAPHVLYELKFAPQGHDEESQLYSRSIRDKAIGFAMLEKRGLTFFRGESQFYKKIKYEMFNDKKGL